LSNKQITMGKVGQAWTKISFIHIHFSLPSYQYIICQSKQNAKFLQTFTNVFNSVSVYFRFAPVLHWEIVPKAGNSS